LKLRGILMELYFKNYLGNLKKISEPDTIGEAERCVRKYCKERSYRIKKLELKQVDGGLVIDVGNHTESFILKECCIDHDRSDKYILCK